MRITDLLYQEEKPIVDEAWRAVSRLEHYGRDGETATRARLDRLYRLVYEAVDTRDLTNLLAAVKEIAQRRFDAGFDLSEVQTAFYALEEAIWRHVLQKLPPEQLPEALGLVSTALGRGKDALGCAYVSLASRTHSPSLDMSELFKGTQG